MTGAAINRHTLDNGLRIVHCEDTSTPDVAFDIAYGVGSRDESPRLTGMAHLFEHLMFGGTPRIPDFDRELEMAGGWSNAWTSADYTNFYDVLPAVNAETAFWLESDRMQGLLFSEQALSIQKSVVVEEFKQTALNRPYGDLSHLLHRLLFKTHPYKTPVIGEDPAHIERVTNDDLKPFFHDHYVPNNAVVAVTGNISFARVIELAEKWFGEIPSLSRVQKEFPSEPPIALPRRLVVHRAVPFPRIVVAFHMTGRDNCDSLEYEAADILTDILASGRASRFYQVLVSTGQLPVADASILGSRDTGYLMLTVQPTSSNPSDIKKAEELLWGEIERLKNDGVTENELLMAVNRFITSKEYEQTGFLNKARNLAVNELTGLDSNRIMARYRALTTEDIVTTARKLLVPDRSATLLYLPEVEKR